MAGHVGSQDRGHHDILHSLLEVIREGVKDVARRVSEDFQHERSVCMLQDCLLVAYVGSLVPLVILERVILPSWAQG